MINRKRSDLLKYNYKSDYRRNHNLNNRRFFSEYVYFPILNTKSNDSILYNSSNNLNFKARLKIPILKSPSHFGHATSRVNRVYNEDKLSAAVLHLPLNIYNKNITNIIHSNHLHDIKEQALRVFNFNIFDGHGGIQTANYLSKNLSKTIESFPINNLNESYLKDLISLYIKKIGGSYWKRFYNKLDLFYKKNFDKNLNQYDDLNLRLPLAFLTLDLQLFEVTKNYVNNKNNLNNPNHNDNEINNTTTINEQNLESSGSTSTSVFIYNLNPNDNKIYFEENTVSKLIISHIGDTKAIICDKYGSARPLTSNHHPSSPVEATRLSTFSSSFFTDSFGEERFLNYANTRAFGDFVAKSKGISAEPDILSFIIGDSKLIKEKNNYINQTVGKIGGDESFLILCSDGVTNHVTDQEIVDLVMSTANRGMKRGSPQFCAEEIVKFVEAVGGDDNATCLVIKLNGWGKWPLVDRTGNLREERLKDGPRRR
ncbi:type 2C protein phosphatase PTC6 [Ascoidea rubescens DSM 1968]|uniref:Protein serine/threonine phosphatase 2C n=1 Tax=Ascoidea rubescens DSM 1968 TaxID=1344418 RepID=A0A1D2VSC5_9ASCO|nr:protein serine/threonine phosphatase 2C [Ascoidea rubescens DSM 1968]ODV64499.1 protein serine/threonine phosphatase 2C [Ascoidea rubescens DSM 1968]